MQVFWPGSRTFQKSPVGLCPFLRHLTATVCLSSVWPGSLRLTEHGDVWGEESPLGLPVAEGRDFWEILRVRGSVKGQGSKGREGAWMGPQTGVWPSPLGTQPEEPKGDQVGSSPPAKTQRELGPLSLLSKCVLSYPSSGHPWHPQLHRPACPCSRTPTRCQRTSATKQDLPDASPVLLALGLPSLGAGEEGSHSPWQGQAGYSRGCPLVPGLRLSLGAPTCDPLQRERAGGEDTLGCLDLRRCSLRLPPSLAPFFFPNPVFLRTTILFISPVVRRSPCSPDGFFWSRQRAGSLQHRLLPRGRRAPCTGSPTAPSLLQDTPPPLASPPKHSTCLPFQPRGTCSPGCKALSLWLCSWSLSQSPLLLTTSGARKSRECYLGSPGGWAGAGKVGPGPWSLL